MEDCCEIENQETLRLRIKRYLKSRVYKRNDLESKINELETSKTQHKKKE